MMIIRLFMCCHKQFETIPPLFEPLQCGTALNPEIVGILHDNDCENISIKNREYCELTAHYYVWKNIIADYYGFCHYRRFFGAESITKRPYIALKKATDKQLLSENDLQKYADEFDIIVPKSENMGLPVREHYITSEFHYAEDLNLFLEILSARFPLLQASAEDYLNQNSQYFCNMFAMSRAHFHDYCSILFTVLDEFDNRKILHGDFQSDRTDGYLGEIFTGIFLTSCRKNGVRIKELPRLDTCCSPAKRLGCAFFPPESKLRFTAKKIAKYIRNKRV